MWSILEQVLAKGPTYGNHMEFFTNHARYHMFVASTLKIYDSVK